MPRGIMVAFDSVDAKLGYDDGDSRLVLVAPSDQTWKWRTRDPTNVWDGCRWVTKPLEIAVTRYQIRLFPEKVMTTQAAQGRTCETMLAHLGKSPRMSTAEYWFNVYVMLSRAPALDPDRLMLFDLPSREFFEEGPPAALVNAMRDLEDLETRTRAFARQVREYLARHHGWPAPETRKPFKVWGAVPLFETRRPNHHMQTKISCNAQECK